MIGCVVATRECKGTNRTHGMLLSESTGKGGQLQLTYQQLPVALNEEDSGRSQQDTNTDGANCIKDAVSGDP